MGQRGFSGGAGAEAARPGWPDRGSAPAGWQISLPGGVDGRANHGQEL